MRVFFITQAVLTGRAHRRYRQVSCGVHHWEERAGKAGQVAFRLTSDRPKHKFANMMIAEFDQFQKSLSASDRVVLDELVVKVLRAAWQRRTDEASTTAKDVVSWMERAGSALSAKECEALSAYALAGGASLPTSAALQDVRVSLRVASKATGDMEPGSSANDEGKDLLMQSTQQMQKLQTSFNLQYLQLQNSLQNENRQFKMVSNIMKTRHDTVKNSISNIH